jgi:predicted nucleotidyltransferase
MGAIIPIMGIDKSYNNVLFSKVQQIILRLLYLNVDVDFNTNEIIRLTKSGTGAVQRELKKLSSASLIIVKHIGNQKRYQANQKLPYYYELRSIIIKTFGLVDILRAELKKNSVIKQVKIAFIYGSFAKQTDTIESDIDLMFIGNDLTYAELFPSIIELEETLGRKINPSYYSNTEWINKYKKNNNFIKQVYEQPKIFLIGSENELKQLR